MDQVGPAGDMAPETGVKIPLLAPKTLTLELTHQLPPRVGFPAAAMRAIAGAVHSSTPCSLAKATRAIAVFTELNATNLPSSDAATYLRTVAEAANELHIFRRGLRRPQGDVADGAHEGGGGGEASERKQGASATAGERKSGMRKGSREDEEMKGQKLGEVDEPEISAAAAAAANRGLQSPGSEKRKKKERKEIRVKEEDVSGDVNQEVNRKALFDGSQGLVSEGGDDEKRARKEKKKEKRVKVEDESGGVNAEESRKALDDVLHGLVSEGGVGSEKKAKKKKRHVKQEEEEVMDAKEAEQQIFHGDLAEHGVASQEKKRKKRKHAEDDEEKKEIVMNGDLGSEKKRKKKRERDGDDGNEKELVEHTKKKQRK